MDPFHHICVSSRCAASSQQGKWNHAVFDGRRSIQSKNVFINGWCHHMQAYLLMFLLDIAVDSLDMALGFEPKNPTLRQYETHYNQMMTLTTFYIQSNDGPAMNFALSASMVCMMKGFLNFWRSSPFQR
jgi:hypothetical protein